MSDKEKPAGWTEAGTVKKMNPDMHHIARESNSYGGMLHNDKLDFLCYFNLKVTVTCDHDQARKGLLQKVEEALMDLFNTPSDGST